MNPTDLAAKERKERTEEPRNIRNTRKKRRRGARRRDENDAAAGLTLPRNWNLDSSDVVSCIKLDSAKRGIPKPAVGAIERRSIRTDAESCEKARRPSPIGEYLSFPGKICEPHETIQRRAHEPLTPSDGAREKTWRRQPDRGFAPMTTSMIALAFFCLLYGFFWNNRPARSNSDGANATRTGQRTRRGEVPGLGNTAPQLQTESSVD